MAEPVQMAGPSTKGEFAAFTTLPKEPARVRVRADLLPAVSVMSLLGLLGVPLGWLWSRLAPPEKVRVFPEGRLVPLQLESWHRFDSLAIYTLLGLALGIAVGTGVWLLRERRGPVLLVAAVAGAALAGWLGTQLGAAFANGLYEVGGPPSVGDVISRAPRVESVIALVAPPIMVAFVYGLLAAWNGHDDLGRRLG